MYASPPPLERPPSHVVAIELAKTIKDQKFTRPSWKMLLKLPEFPLKILQIFGSNNFNRVKGLTGSKVSQKYAEIEGDFVEFMREYFEVLREGGNLKPVRASRLGSRSSFASRSSLTLRIQVLLGLKEYLGLHPFPYQLACHYRIYKILPFEKEGEAPFTYAKRIQDNRIRIINEVYKILGPKPPREPLYFSFYLHEVLDHEMALLKCRASPHVPSWRLCIEEWAKEKDENAEIVRVAQELLKMHHLTPLLKQEETSEKSDNDFTMELSSMINEADSFYTFILTKTIAEIICDLLREKSIQLDNFLLSLFENYIQEEADRQALMFFVSVMIQSYQKIPKVEPRNFTYEPYRGILRDQLKLIKHLTYTYVHQKHPKVESSYQLPVEKQALHELLLSCLLMMHFSQLFTKCSIEDKLQMLQGILKMSRWEKKALYADCLLQIPSRKILQGCRISDVLVKSHFSDQRKALLIIKMELFHLGLRTEPGGGKNDSPMDFAGCYQFLERIAQFSHCAIPEDALFFGLLWQYVEEDENDLLDHMERLQREISQNYLKQFFIPWNIVEQVKISGLLKYYKFPNGPDFSGVEGQQMLESAERSVQSLRDCVSYALIPECFPKCYLPYVFLMLNLDDLSLVSARKWGFQHRCVLRELTFQSRTMWVDAFWKQQRAQEYFHLSFIFLASLRFPHSCCLEVSLNISRRRIEWDETLQKLLFILLPYLCDDFQQNVQEVGGRQNFFSLEDILSKTVDDSIKVLWQDYKADDKEEISRSLYQFCYDLKVGTRESMLRLASSFPEKKVLGRNVCVANGVYSLVPGSLDPKEVIFQESYRELASDLIAQVSKNKSVVLEDFFKLDLEVPYSVSVKYKCNFEESGRSPSLFEPLVQESVKGKEREKPKQDFAAPEEFISPCEEGLGGEEKRLHEVIVFLTELPDVSFTVVYPMLPTIELICWQLAMLKSRYYEKHPLQKE
ncbi:MAG: hypothetical protein CK425_02505 [Parachlamydia sp.]|nr:MAG: hypothetical protein CK425_02505 [Parachlamydia sp.]